MSQNQPTVIRAAHYGETEERLSHDPIVLRMATEAFAAGIKSTDLVHDGSDCPTFEWMQRANAGYRANGGTDGGHIGAVATAIAMVLRRIETAIA